MQCAIFVNSRREEQSCEQKVVFDLRLHNIMLNLRILSQFLREVD